MRPASPRGKEVNDKERAQLTANAAAWLADHRYTQLVNNGDVEVWRCQTPGSNNLAFDICVTRYGMSVFGDIDGLVFRVGASYGINFLRHQSDGYLHEKLDGCNRDEREFDKENFLERICDAILTRAEEELPDDAVPDLKSEQHNEVLDWLREQRDAETEGLPFDELADLLDEAIELDDDSDPQRAYDMAHENEDLLGVSDTWEWSYDQPSRSLMQRLYYVRHAADQIMAMKELGSPAQ